MCEPMMVLTTLAVTTAVVGTGLTAYGQHKQGQFQKGMGKYQANLEKERARISQENAAIEAQEEAQRRRLRVGQAKAAAAAAGLTLDSSPLDAAQIWEQDQAYLGTYDTWKIRRNAELEQWGFMSNASMLRAQGAQAGRAGSLAAGGTIVAGMGDVAAKGVGAMGAYRDYQAGR